MPRNNLDRELRRTIFAALRDSGEVAGEGFILRLADIATEAALEVVAPGGVPRMEVASPDDFRRAGMDDDA